MSLIYICNYGISAKPALQQAAGVDPEFAEFLVSESVIFRSQEGGNSSWREADQLAKVKLLFLIYLKREYDEPFIRDAPLCLEFFDQWWTVQRFDDAIRQQDILDNVGSNWAAQFVSTGLPLVDTMFRDLAAPELRTEFPSEKARYRIWWAGDVVGWVEDPKWRYPELRGKWSPTVNAKGIEFSRIGEDGRNYRVVVDGPLYLHGELIKSGSDVAVNVSFASAEK